MDVDGAGDPLMRKGNSGFYVLAEKTSLSQERAIPAATLTASSAMAGLMPISTSFPAISRRDWFSTAWLPGRDEDQFAVSFSHGPHG